MIPSLRYQNGQLISAAVQSSFLSEPASAGDAQVFLQDYVGFLDNQFIIIEDLGTETAEIASINGTPSTNAGAVLDAVLARSHPAGSKVTIIDFDRFELSHSTTSTGSKTNLTTTLGSGLVAVQADIETQVYNESEYSTGYYFARYKNSISGNFSDYTDALAFGGWDKNTVGYMVDRSLRDLDEELSEKVTRFDCYEWVNTCLKLIQGKLKRWPEHFSFNAVIGQTSRGLNVVAMPSDVYDTETNKSIIAVRIGDRKRLAYLDPRAFETQLEGVISTQVRTQASAAATSLAIDNSYDFPDSGSVNVYIGGTKYTLTYTGVTRSATAGVLTGIPASGVGAIAVTIPVDTYIWNGEQEGIPQFFTVRNGNIEFWPLVGTGEDNQNIYSDYSHVATVVDSDGDTIDFQRYDMVQSYLTWRMKMKAKNAGTLDQNDGFYLMFKEKMNDAIRTLPNSIVYGNAPRINRMGKRPSGKRRADLQDLDVSEQ